MSKKQKKRTHIYSTIKSSRMLKRLLVIRPPIYNN